MRDFFQTINGYYGFLLEFVFSLRKIAFDCQSIEVKIATFSRVFEKLS